MAGDIQMTVTWRSCHDLRLQSSADHVQYIATVAQGNRQEQGEVVEDDGVGTDLLAEGDVFQ